MAGTLLEDKWTAARFTRHANSVVVRDCRIDWQQDSDQCVCFVMGHRLERNRRPHAPTRPLGQGLEKRLGGRFLGAEPQKGGAWPGGPAAEADPRAAQRYPRRPTAGRRSRSPAADDGPGAPVARATP